jgi:hypothetical protein
MTIGLQLGRPGVYRVEARRPDAFRPVRLDVAGFVGVALRGPVDDPTPVQSWSDYERRFGGFERSDGGADRLLPYAVQAFFAQGGERAHIVRVAPPAGFSPTAEEATASYVLDAGARGRWDLAAADEGTWGGHLAVTLAFVVSRTFRASLVRTHDASTLVLESGLAPPEQTLARIRLDGGPASGELRWTSVDPAPATRGRVVQLDRSVDVPGSASGADEGVPVDVDVLTATVTVSDRSSTVPREERFDQLGLRPGHPRFVADVLRTASVLVRPSGDWSAPLLPDRFLGPVTVRPGRRGLDRSYGIVGASFFDDGDAGDDPLDEQTSHRGADAAGRVEEIGLLCAPDLAWRTEKRVLPPDPPPRRPADPCDPCAACADLDVPQTPLQDPPSAATGLDPRVPDDLAELVARQRRLVQVADLRKRFVVLLDAPAGLSLDRVTEWRAGFDTSYAAAYHPWLGVPRVRTRPTDADTIVATAPSGFAAGIIAARERRFGLAYGAANELAAGAVVMVDAVDDAAHDRLHQLGVNVYRLERDGVRLSAARTLSTDPDYRQLSARRFMTMLALTIERQAAHLVFEPNTAELRARLTHALVQLLRGQQRRGAFAGDSEATSFFVRCDAGTNPPGSQGLGRLVAEIGVALSAPLEYLVLRISQDVDGGLVVGDDGG